jgi:hypothetical protein
VASTGIKGTAWASGQLVSYLRTPMLYYQTALLTEQGFRSIACGTTNRDEGSYIGFFGKASDGSIDSAQGEKHVVSGIGGAIAPF